MMARMVGRLHGIVVDCPDPAALATFYEQVLGMVRVQDDGDFIVIGDAPDRPGVAFQRVSGHRPPDWPAEPAQVHFDVRVDDLDAAERKVVTLGAIRLPGGGPRFRVFADPAGHPFCLVAWR